MSCHGQVKIAESHGVGKEDALAMLHHYYAAGGKRPTRGGKNNSARTLIDWEGELGKMSKSGLHNSQPEPLKESPKSATKKKRSPDLPSIKLPITERERPIIEWIDRKAAAERRNRSGQVWALLEEIMKGEGA